MIQTIFYKFLIVIFPVARLTYSNKPFCRRIDFFASFLIRITQNFIFFIREIQSLFIASRTNSTSMTIFFNFFSQQLKFFFQFGKSVIHNDIFIISIFEIIKHVYSSIFLFAKLKLSNLFDVVKMLFLKIMQLKGKR